MSYEYMEDVGDVSSWNQEGHNLTKRRLEDMTWMKDLNHELCRSIRKTVDKIEDKEGQKVLDYIDDIKECLPPDIVKRVYIWWFRLYWRSYRPLTAKEPTWQKRKNYVDRQIWDSRLKNIHFLHMSFNTLDQHKKWIMGCQCDFCKEGGGVSRKRKRYLTRMADKEGGGQSSMPNESNHYRFINENNSVHVINKPGLKGNYHYDPFYGSPYESGVKWSMRRPGRPLELSYTEPIAQSSDHPVDPQ